MSVAEAPVILFDGVCKLCSAWANFIIEHDTEHRFRLCSVQSAAGQRLLGWATWATGKLRRGRQRARCRTR